MIARVFPRRTKATPQDDYAFTGAPGLFIPEDITEVHISVTFTSDLPEAERLAKAWERIAPVKIGGPATGQRGEAFTPGMYLKPGYVITSRGCPNRCWFCSVPIREGQQVRELPITEGYNVLDDNLLACSKQHILDVFAMLKRAKAKGNKIEFTGGLEAKRLRPWHVDLLKDLRPKQIFFAYDTPQDFAYLYEATKLFEASGYGSRDVLRAYVLIGFQGDTIEAAERRLRSVMDLGVCPMAMLYRDGKNEPSREWKRFQRQWARPAAIYATNRRNAA